jgi:lysophospholipase L1-like esterase
LETLAPTTTWPAVAARRLGVAGTNLGFAGEAMLDPFVARTIRDLPADLISLKLGVNVVGTQTLSPRAFRTAAHGFVDTIRENHPTTPLVLVSAIFCPIHENGTDAGPLTIAGSRDILAEVVAARADDPNLHYLDGLSLLGADEADLLPDDLHPDTEGYRRMGERFAEFAAGLL